MKKLGFMVLLILITYIFGLNISAYSENDVIATYTGENGVKIISYSNEWRYLYQLKAVYEELMKNGHGEEMAYLDAVYIFPEAKTGIASLYYDSYSKVGTEYVYNPGRYIEIYNGDELTEVKDIARILSHEYGHHFMFYYLVTEENIPKSKWINSNYAAVRGLKNYSQVTYLGDTQHTYSHKWDIAEILSDDYVQLYGSTLARSSRDYKDVTERIAAGTNQYYYYYNDFNLLPQENLELPLAADVNGLATYFYLLTGIKTNQVYNMDVPEPKLSEINNVYKFYNEYVFEWNPVVSGSTGTVYEYTLVISDANNNDYPIPIRTVHTGESLKGVYGSAISSDGKNAILVNLEGFYELQLFVKDQSGIMHGSDIVPLKITAKDNAPVVFTDISDNYWATEDIYHVTSYGIVKGYPDSTFRPSNTITRGEILAFLIRSLSDYELTESPNNPNWFFKEGFSTAAKDLGLVDSAHDTVTYYIKNVTREEIAHYIYVLLNYKDISTNINYTSLLTDIGSSSYRKDITVINYYGIINGYPDGTFKPKQNANRAEAIKLIQRFMALTGYM